MIKQSRIKYTLKQCRKYKFLLILLIPGLTAMIIFQYIPMVGILMAFQNYKIKTGLWHSQWVGLKNFIYILSNPQTLQAIGNSLIISAYSIAVTFPLTIVFALMLNEVRAHFAKRAFQTLSYLPFFLSWVIVSKFLMDVLSPTSGLVNSILGLFGAKPIYFMAEPNWFKTLVVFSNLWKNIGFNAIIYLAAMSGVSEDLYEAATIDGAGRFQKIRHVTLPSIYFVISITLIFSFSTLFSGGDFEQIMNMINTQTTNAGQVVSTLTYKFGFGQMQYSLSTAMSLFNSVVSIIMLFIANIGVKKLTEQGIW